MSEISEMIAGCVGFEQPRRTRLSNIPMPLAMVEQWNSGTSKKLLAHEQSAFWPLPSQ